MTKKNKKSKSQKNLKNETIQIEIQIENLMIVISKHKIEVLNKKPTKKQKPTLIDIVQDKGNSVDEDDKGNDNTIQQNKRNNDQSTQQNKRNNESDTIIDWSNVDLKTSSPEKSQKRQYVTRSLKKPRYMQKYNVPGSSKIVQSRLSPSPSSSSSSTSSSPSSKLAPSSNSAPSSNLSSFFHYEEMNKPRGIL
ncbi:hypothetical protein C1646_775889 [Rhizophagus diaphanus]|nr:hypothetical protein C1646_775889 [Rhizophagus diaphanus] [Rhizophagus sp. MUCL 43196]